MAQQNFIDYVKICCRSGRGGAGAVHFHRDRTTAKGGPDGGDGGRGGHIILRGNRNMWTLLPLKYRKHVIAGKGENGSANLRTGADGDDVILEVPLGTIARDVETGEQELEITNDQEEKILVKGGRGGQGNYHFRSATRQTPRFAQEGGEGKEEWKILELKVLADVGLVGFPNAGKSTLLAALSAAKPKIGAYPFTTLTPNLGIVSYRDTRSFVMADIPGIIEGASAGKGLGTQFLRHIERNAVLLFVIPSDAEDIGQSYQILLKELEQYDPQLLQKERLVAISKADLIDEELQSMIAEELSGLPPYCFISAVTGEGILSLKDRLWRLLN